MGTNTLAKASLAHVVLVAWERNGITCLRELDDPEFFGQWSAVRTQIALIRTGSPEHAEIKPLYDAMTGEFRRRLSGALAATAQAPEGGSRR